MKILLIMLCLLLCACGQVLPQATNVILPETPTAQATPTEIMTQAIPTEVPTNILSTDIPTPMPIDPADYQGWWNYTNDTYGFSLLIPSDWVVDETITGDPLMNGHMILIHPKNEAENLGLRVAFRNAGEEVPLWPTGVGQGEFVPLGTLDVAGEPVRRILLVCPNGQINSIYYQGKENEANIQRGNMAFGFIYSFTGGYCQEGYSLNGKIQRVGEMTIASLKLP